MVRILCTALNAKTGPHFKLLADASHNCLLPDRSLDLWNEEVLTVPTGYTTGRHKWRLEY